MKATEMFKQSRRISSKRGNHSLFIMLGLMEQFGAAEPTGSKQTIRAKQHKDNKNLANKQAGTA